MLRCEKVPLTKLDPTTSLRHSWNVTLPDGREMPWRGFSTGPLTLADDEIESLCRTLLSMDSVGLQEAASCELRPRTIMESMRSFLRPLTKNRPRLLKRCPTSMTL